MFKSKADLRPITKTVSETRARSCTRSLSTSSRRNMKRSMRSSASLIREPIDSLRKTWSLIGPKRLAVRLMAQKLAAQAFHSLEI